MTDIVKYLKGITGRKLFERFPEIREKLWKGQLWNVCNYERIHYKELELEKYPDWYYQKSHHKEDIWYKALPSQTAQEVCKLLDKSWKSFYALQRTGGIVNPRPPRFKQNGIAVTYMQNGIKHEEGGEEVRLEL